MLESILGYRSLRTGIDRFSLVGCLAQMRKRNNRLLLRCPARGVTLRTLMRRSGGDSRSIRFLVCLLRSIGWGQLSSTDRFLLIINDLI